MKRKQQGRRSRFRRRKDDALLLAYARYEYQQARKRKAVEMGVDVALIQDRLGWKESVEVGRKRLVAWFEALPDPQRTVARRELANTMAQNRLTEADVKAAQDAIARNGAVAQ
jgi:hypothetical protein